MLINIKKFIMDKENCKQTTNFESFIDSHIDIMVYSIGALMKANLYYLIEENDFTREVIKWQKERKLDKKEFNIENELSFIFEEFLELCLNKKSEDVREKAIKYSKEFINTNTIEQKHFKDIYTEANYNLLTFDCIFDIECLKNEVIKELNSRIGSFIDGKWVKDKNAKIYKANFNNCREKEYKND